MDFPPDYQELIGGIATHRIVGAISLDQANTAFLRMLQAFKADEPAPSLTEVLKDLIGQ